MLFSMFGNILINFFRILTSSHINKCAATRDFKQSGILTSEDLYEPVQSHFKLRNSN